ncbi:hypothetical protein LTR95_008255 [Oleoguttula sp. CCFEE 5521]
MSSSTFKSNPGGDRTSEELLHDVGINRVLGYLADAVADAQSIAEKRPSEVKRGRVLGCVTQQEVDENDDADFDG